MNNNSCPPSTFDFITFEFQLLVNSLEDSGILVLFEEIPRNHIFQSLVGIVVGIQIF
jgi:hypothetical protein